jgi:RNA polymerase sigma-70 factor (ECF subfamily)
MRQDPSDAARTAALEAAIKRLPARQREIFIAAWLHDMRAPEIAERTGLSVAQVERHLVKAVSRLSRAMPRHRSGPWWRRLARWIAHKGR